MSLFFRRIQLRLTYYLGKFAAFFGFCCRCGSRLNFTRSGRGICPGCDHRY